MEDTWTDVLRPEERITLRLRALYEQFGYRKYHMGKFEAYELYLENKNFLKKQNIITFHDLDGRVLALKPDVTLSIAKNTRATAASSEKVYYLENVYWLEKQSAGYRETTQLGLEYIGRLDSLASFEAVWLAQRTLSAISDRHRMQISHIGFWVSLLDGLGIEEAGRKELLSCVHGKRLHELTALLEGFRVPEAAVQMILKAASLSGEFLPTLQEARQVAISGGMSRALDELMTVYALLREKNAAEDLVLDFSLVNDIDYYDGLIFQGFVEGVPRALLAGGYYGRLMRRFDRELDAIGFAVYLNELNNLFRSRHRDSAQDALLLYDGDADPAALLAAADELRQKGLRVRMEQRVPDELAWGHVYRYGKNGCEEVRGLA